MIGFQLTCQAELSVCEHVGAPDPLLTQGGLVTFLACTLHQLFDRLCDLAHNRSHIVHMSMSVPTTASRSFCLFVVCLRCPSVLKMDELQGLLAPLSGITLTTRVIRSQHYTLFNSYKLVRPPRSPVQMSASTRESRAPPSSSVSCPQVTLSATHPQVQMGPTRTPTSDLLSATLAEAATQLSFAAFLERCIFVSASPPPQLSVSTPPLDAATQTLPPHRCLSGCFYATLIQGVLGFTFYA